MKWNPMSLGAAFELSELHKATGDTEGFYTITKNTYNKIFKRSDFARYLRNIAYYFVEKENYEVASACLFVSCSYEDNTKARSELFYIRQKSGRDIPAPSEETLKNISKEYNIMFEVSEDILGIAIEYSKEVLKYGDTETAKYMLDTLYSLTLSDETKRTRELLG